MRLQLPLIALVLALTSACGDDKGGGSSGSTSAGTTENTSQSTGQGTSTGGTDASTTDEPTTGATATGTGTDSGTDSGTGTTDSGTTDPGSTTGTVLPNFERFKQSSAAGPCPPDSDCDGFVELLSTRLLRVEKFGELDNPVTEVEISEDDFNAAVAVFADEALVALLDSPDPLCQPPTDIFESMEVVIDGELHDASTTSCDPPPLVAAREKATELRMKYAP